MTVAQDPRALPESPTTGGALEPPNWTPAEPLYIRPHNLLCLQGWQGMGYSPAFTANMDRVFHHLRAHPESRVTLSSTTDVICSACPGNTHGDCIHDLLQDGVMTAHDGRTLARLGLIEGGTYTYGELELAVAQGMRGADVAQHCAFCRWEPLGVCAAGIDSLRTRLAAQASGNGPVPAGV